ncbi:FAD dependent oxidoreductase [Dichotomopilus funicola]|uniref:FAD dependent oxidoreductase n=1 Tax=Dichotomopilus funicola TaxID=1934379 RepID=A0AAN6V6D0_9PEZI|nr:FAD dependent oxidoreductase [Dichotomopilus funicola]
MNERAKIPVLPPSAHPTTSTWQDPPDASLANHRSTPDLPAEVDTIIIGSGITGAAVAWGLLQGESPLDQAGQAGQDKGDGKAIGILMLEAREACSGATGRNGGHTKAATYRTFTDHFQTHTPAIARQIALLERANISAVHAFAREHGFDGPSSGPSGPTGGCDLQTCDTVDVVYDADEWEEALEGVAAMREAFASSSEAGGDGDQGSVETPERHRVYTREEALAAFPVHDGVYNGREERVQGAVRYAAGSLSAYQFGIGVLRLCVDRGLNLQTGTMVTEVKRVGEGEGEGIWEVYTPRGVVKAKRVVLATNGYTAAVWKRFQGVVVPMRGQITAQRPGKNMPNGGSLETTYSFIYKNGYEYMITRPANSKFAGDLIMGGGLVRIPDDGLAEFGTTDDGSLNEEISEYLRESTARYFGSDWGEDHADGRVRSEWTGIMGFSPDGFPFVGEVPGERGLWTSCSFQGHGMVLCWMCAKALVAMMDGRDGDELREWFPDVFRITEERLALEFQGRLDACSTGAE